ncbi:hypothetical protein FNV43_RR23573 [Rhamnella rubrinervis]|uniref:Uncharacterized protein n=1 Tax=Rhamnella rubrinervis TaxID=2594499 RepID=A0A8K0GT37_9ROSA|nr:hypothetical protein FNV43_RR23573 [Rhamnella rubrinervis]
MEKKSTRKAEKKTQISIPGGGGIGGLVMVGGALAIAGLVAAFTFNKRRRHANNKNSTKLTDDASKHPINNCLIKTEDQPNQGKGLLHTSTNFHDSVSIQCLILDEKPTTETDGQERISDILVTASGDSEKERILVGDDSGVPLDKDCLEDDPIPLKTTEGEKKEDELFPTPTLAVEEKQENDNGECVVEKANESSENKGDSTIELNTGAIIEEEVKLEAANQAERITEEQELKTVKAGEHVNLNGNSNDNVFSDDHHPNENESWQESKTKILWHTNRSMAINKLTVNSSKLRIWVLSMFMLVLLLLSFSFTPHKAVSFVLSLFSDFQSTVINRSS